MDNLSQLAKSRSQFAWGLIDSSKKQVIKKYSGKKILDIGCSRGDYVKYLFSQNYDAYGCDILAVKQWNGELKKRFKTADIYKLPYENNFAETVLLFDVLEHLDNLDQGLKEVIRVISKNIIIAIPNCDDPGAIKKAGLLYYHYVDRTHVRFFTKAEIEKVLKRYKLNIEYFKYTHPVMPETILLSSWYLPLRLAEFIGKLMQRVPLNKKYYQGMLIVAAKN